MSHAIGAVRFPDGHIMFFEYDGTADVVFPRLRDTPGEVEAHWRRPEWDYRDCKHPIEPVEVASTYGNVSWDATACRTCAYIVDDGMDGEGFVRGRWTKGLPDWVYLNDQNIFRQSPKQTP